MLYWICPECGRECSPAIRECPTCTQASESAPAASGVVQQQAGGARESSGKNTSAAPAAPPQAVGSQHDSVPSSNGSSVATVIAAVLTPEQYAAERLAAEQQAAEQALDWLVRPLVESAPPADRRRSRDALKPALPADPKPPRAPAGEPLSLPQSLAALSANQAHSEVVPLAEDLAPLWGVRPRPAPPSEPEKPAPSGYAAPSGPAQPAVVVAPPTRQELALTPADLSRLHQALNPAPAGEIQPPALPEATVTPLESVFREPVFASAHVTPAPEPLVHSVHDPALLEEALEHHVRTLQEAVASAPAPSEQTGIAETSAAISEAQALQAERVVDEITRRLEAEQAGIEAVAATFREQPTTCLLPAPAEIVLAPAPPCLQWMKMPKPVIPPSIPLDADFSRLIGAPQTPTLAGACLPPQLRRFKEQPAVVIPPARKLISFPTWLVSVVVATCLFLLAGTLIQFLTSNRDANTASASVTPAPRPAQPAPVTAPAPAVHEHPAARFVEVAGVRLVTAANHKPQLAYIVVNHSGSELTGLDIRIAGRSPDTPVGTAPLFSVSSVIASLGPFQSKELRTDLDSSLRTAAIPDWQSLHTEILVARH